ncbi:MULTISPECIES: hypothetical protein [unclassified Psychrobacter]|uniref:hypothetical protein n=1 Tax=unclassified Psychrobacter TaxID=196806 RepID=UPI003FD19108
MDWLKNILQFLPLDTLSDILGEIVIWWSQMVKGVPPADLPMYAYIGGTVVVLLLWLLVARMLPRPLGGMTWMVLFAVLLAPGTALGDPSLLAPASIGVVYALMMKDTTAAINSALPILVVLVVGLFIGFLWQLIRGAFESSLAKARANSAEDTQATMQLTTGHLAMNNYAAKDSLDLSSADSTNANSVSLHKTQEKVPLTQAPIVETEPKKVRKGFYSEESAAQRVIDKAKRVKPSVELDNPANKKHNEE